MPEEKSKIYISPPQSSNSLVDQVWAFYDRSPRNTKSRAMQRLLEGGIALENLGILDAVIALALSEPISSHAKAHNQQTAAMVLGRLLGDGVAPVAAPVQIPATTEGKAPSAVVTEKHAVSESHRESAVRLTEHSTEVRVPDQADRVDSESSKRRIRKKHAFPMNNLMSLEGKKR